MAHTLTVLTLWLAQAIGLWFAAAAFSTLIAPGRTAAMREELAQAPALAHLFGLALFAIGVGILIPHHVTYDPLAAIVTTLAAVLALAGLALAAVPQAALALAGPLVAAERLVAIVALVFGLILFLAGLTGRADALP